MVRDDESLWLRPRSQFPSVPFCGSRPSTPGALSCPCLTGSSFSQTAISDPNSRASYIYRVPLSLQSGCRITRGCLIINIYTSQWYQLAFYKTEDGTVPGMGHFEDRCYDNTVIRHQVRGWPRDTHEELLAPPSVPGGKELVPTVTD